VFTGVCLTGAGRQLSFTDETKVWFKELSDEEIRFYIQNYKPFDKAGSYGAQDWLGLIGVTKIEGSYFNVMGLPVHRLYEELEKF
jgi:septum formation protein